MELAIRAIYAFGVDEQDSIVVGWDGFVYPLGYSNDQANLQFVGEFYQGGGFWTREYNGPILKMGDDILVSVGCDRSW